MPSDPSIERGAADRMAHPRPRAWMICIFCERYFRFERLRGDYRGNGEGCPFCACSGLGVAIFPWHAHPSRPRPSNHRPRQRARPADEERP